MIDISTGKAIDGTNGLSPEPMTRRDFGKGLAGILAAGVAPSLCAAVTGGYRRDLGMRMAAMGGGKALPYDYQYEYVKKSLSTSTWDRLELTKTYTTSGDYDAVELTISFDGDESRSSPLFGSGMGAFQYVTTNSDNTRFVFNGYSTAITNGVKYTLLSRKVDGFITINGNKYGWANIMFDSNNIFATPFQMTSVSPRIYGWRVWLGDDLITDMIPVNVKGATKYFNKVDNTFESRNSAFVGYGII